MFRAFQVRNSLVQKKKLKNEEDLCVSHPNFALPPSRKISAAEKVVKNRGDDCDDANNDDDDNKGNADVLAAAFATLERIVCRSDKF